MFTTKIKHIINYVINPINLHIDSLTKERAEAERLRGLMERGHFSEPVFPVPPEFDDMDWRRIVSLIQEFEGDLGKLATTEQNEVDYTYENIWYTSPDAEVLYALVRDIQPQRIVEIGCGNSTKLFRQAIIDEGLDTTLTSIDPNPRTDIADYSDNVRRERVEMLGDLEPFEELEKEDILFIDSSHFIQTGNDVVFLYLNVLPRLPAGCLVHVHDVFLPYDYPAEWKVEKGWEWNEQYLVQAMLQYGNGFDVLWAGHYLQRSILDEEEFNRYFPRSKKAARSLWLRKKVQR